MNLILLIKKCYANVNEYLKIPDDKVDSWVDYKEFFVDDQLLRDH